MIEDIVYHVLNKEHGSLDNISIDLNPNTLTITNATNSLLEQLVERYQGTAGKGYGVFESDIDSFPTSKILSDYLDVNHADDFYATTERLMNVLKTQSETYVFAKGGKVIFIRYKDSGTDYFLVAILTEKVGLMAQNWDLTQDEILNFENLRFAGRINLTEWQDALQNPNNQRRYISFLRGKREVADYFKKFMGCDDVLMASKETSQLVTYTKDFATEQSLTLDKRVRFMRDTQEYLKELVDTGTDFSLQAFANRVWPDNPQTLINSFEAFGTAHNFNISDGFIPDKRSLRGLTVHSYRTKHWAFTFDNDACSNNDVEVDVENGKVIFNKFTQNKV